MNKIQCNKAIKGLLDWNEGEMQPRKPVTEVAAASGRGKGSGEKHSSRDTRSHNKRSKRCGIPSNDGGIPLNNETSHRREAATGPTPTRFGAPGWQRKESWLELSKAT